MASYTRDLKKRLKKAGCYFHEQGKGDHETWYSPATKRYFTVDNNIKSRHTANVDPTAGGATEGVLGARLG